MSLASRRTLFLVLSIISGLSLLWQAGRASGGQLDPTLFGGSFLVFAITAPAYVYYKSRNTDWNELAKTVVQAEQTKAATRRGGSDAKK